MSWLPDRRYHGSTVRDGPSPANPFLDMQETEDVSIKLGSGGAVGGRLRDGDANVFRGAWLPNGSRIGAAPREIPVEQRAIRIHVSIIK